MSHTASTPHYTFSLEGDFLGFIGSDLRKPSSIVLEVEQESVAIGLPKRLRAYASLSLKPGDRLRCIGRSNINFEAGVIELEASTIFLPSALERPLSSLPMSLSQMTSTCAADMIVRQNKRSELGNRSARQDFKILICRKKGCQKRGGQALVAALERALETHQLQGRVEICYTGCQKRCSKAPNLTIMPGNYHYEGIQAEDVEALIEEHFHPSKSC